MLSHKEFEEAQRKAIEYLEKAGIIITEEEKKNIDTVLLLEPKNEEANYMLMEIELKRSNYLKVRELAQSFSKICIELCGKEKIILESLKDLEPKNES